MCCIGKVVYAHLGKTGPAKIGVNDMRCHTPTSNTSFTEWSSSPSCRWAYDQHLDAYDEVRHRYASCASYPYRRQRG